MARNKTLTKLLDDLRVEARLSLNPAHNNQVRDSHVTMLQREQERLWEDFTWPHMQVKRYIPVQAGQRTYDPNGTVDIDAAIRADLAIDRISLVEFKSDGKWLPVCHGIDARHHNTHDSDLDERSWPVAAWQISEQDQIEVWPIPDANADSDTLDGYIRLTGIRNLRPLVADGDRCDLDGRLMVLYVAANILAASGAKDAQLKVEAANKLYFDLRGGQVKTKRFRMFGVGERETPRRPMISRYRPAE